MNPPPFPVGVYAANDDIDYIKADPAMMLQSIDGNINVGYLPALGIGLVIADGKVGGGLMSFDELRGELIDALVEEFNPGDINRWTETVTAAIQNEAAMNSPKAPQNN